MAKANIKPVQKKTQDSEKANTVLECGIVMPISSIDNCTSEHWREVLEIIKDAVDIAGFKGRLVSESEDSGIIQKRIIQNLYSDPIVVCDVSGKNPNVMFELGMRLAFDKPTIIIKDDKTDYSFDTSPIEHLSYPRDLRFNSIVTFKEQLTEKIKATYKKSTEDRNYTTFLKHFGKFKVAQIDEQEIGKDEFILESIEELRNEVRRMNLRPRVVERPVELGRLRDIEKFNIVKSKIRAFEIENEIQNLAKEVQLNDDIRQQFYKFVERQQEVRKYFEGPQQLRSTVDFILNTD